MIMNAMQHRVLVIDDELGPRESLRILLKNEYEVITADSVARGLQYLRERQPDAIVMDIRMPGTSGIELFERLAEAGLLTALPVIFLTGHGDVPTAVATVKRGAFDFVEKPFSDNALVDRIVQALEASRTSLEGRRERDKVAQALAELTEREREVMRLVIDGKPNKLVADALGISVRTVEVHRARVFDKMKVRSAVELANLLRAQDAGAG